MLRLYIPHSSQSRLLVFYVHVTQQCSFVAECAPQSHSTTTIATNPSSWRRSRRSPACKMHHNTCKPVHRETNNTPSPSPISNHRTSNNSPVERRAHPSLSTADPRASPSIQPIPSRRSMRRFRPYQACHSTRHHGLHTTTAALPLGPPTKTRWPGVLRILVSRTRIRTSRLHRRCTKQRE